MQTNNKLGTPVSGREVRSMYLDAPSDAGPKPRFIVSLVVPYGGDIDDGVETAKEAGAAALALTMDDGSEGTMWMVYDRETKEHHLFDQGELADLMYKEGLA